MLGRSSRSGPSERNPGHGPDFDDIKLIDYDFAEYGSTEHRSELMDRWGRDVGGVGK